MKSRMLLLLMLGLAVGEVYRISLTKKKHKPIRLSGEYKQFQNHPKFYKFSNNKVVQNPVSTPDGYYYATNITVGTPEQPFSALIDTTSTSLIVVDSSCFVINIGDCPNKTFDSSKSSTYQFIKNFTGDGSPRIEGQDTVRLGSIGAQQIAIPNTKFVQNPSEYDIHFKEGIDAILGLAIQAPDQSWTASPIINAINQSLLDKPIFTVYLKQGSNTNDFTSDGGTITYGGIDTENCGSIIAYQPLSSVQYYQFTISGIAIGSYSSSKSYQAIANSGVALIFGPQYIIVSIANSIGAVYDKDQNYLIDCDAEIPDFIVTIGNHQYIIDSKHQISEKDSDGKCYWQFMYVDNGGFGPQWTIGSIFMQEYCTVFDIGNKQIGFAQAKQT